MHQDGTLFLRLFLRSGSGVGEDPGEKYRKYRGIAQQQRHTCRTSLKCRFVVVQVDCNPPQIIIIASRVAFVWHRDPLFINESDLLAPVQDDAGRRRLSSAVQTERRPRRTP